MKNTPLTLLHEDGTQLQTKNPQKNFLQVFLKNYKLKLFFY
jgi:hypothetical protein